MSCPSSPWWKGATIYQIYPRSFLDSNGDGIGDLNGIRRKLDHVASLNVDAIWLSPFFTSPMKDFGYDVADYCGVDPMFGTLEDFDTLVEEAHARGLRAGKAGPAQRRTGMSGPTRSLTDRRPITGNRSLAGHPGSGTAGASNTISTISSSPSPT